MFRLCSFFQGLVFLFVFVFLNPSLSYGGSGKGTKVQHQFALTAFVDTGFRYQHTLQGSTDDLSWTINEIELALQYDYGTFVSTRVALNYMDRILPYNGISIIDSIVQEGFVQVNAGFGKNWKFYSVLGRYLATPGWESVNPVDRVQMTQSLVNDSTPSTTTGAKLGIAGSWLDFNVQVVNGFDQLKELDTLPTLGVSAAMTFGLFQISTSFFTGNEPYYVKENATAEEKQIGMFDFQLVFALPNNRFLAVGEFVVAASLLKPVLWYGMQFTLHGMFHPKWIGATLRYSRLGDQQNLRGFNGDIDEVSFALLSRPYQGLQIMTEYRIDLTQSVGDSQARIKSHTVGLKMIYRFDISHKFVR